MCSVPSDALKNHRGLCLALRASNSLVIFCARSVCLSKQWRLGRNVLLLKNLWRCLRGLTGEWEEMVSWQRRGLIPASGMEKRWQESLCRQWWLEGRQGDLVLLPQEAQSHPMDNGSSSSLYSLPRVSHNKVEIASVRNVKQA